MTKAPTARLSTTEQLKILSSPATLEVLEALQTGGPAPASELGPRLGRKANSLHYHLRKLVSAGMVEQVDSNRSGARTEAVYDVVARKFVGDQTMKNKRFRKATTDAVASILRLASRTYTSAAESHADLTLSGKRRNILATRDKARLTQQQLAQVNEHIDAIEQVFEMARKKRRGNLYALTMVMTPLPETGPNSTNQQKRPKR